MNIYNQANKRWLSDLLTYVHTTKKQAQQIKERNLKALEVMASLEKDLLTGHLDVRIPIGCPHCKEVLSSCKRCSFCPLAYMTTQDMTGCSCPCSQTLFDGVTANDLETHAWSLNLQPDAVYIQYFKSYKSEKADRALLTRFLQAHIEWADAVLQKGDSR